ncbi:hypothetical protein Slu03_19530 [Sediminihabitans luteus]|nr:hypothetical protein Slu03_19530 [Sediminihabitans luteus]
MLPVLAVALTASFLVPTASAAAPRPAAPSAAAPSAGHDRPRTVVVPTLAARATLSADYSAPGPDSGALATPGNGRTGPFEGQVVPGFSAMVEDAHGSFWALPDNGFGTQANSADFLLRFYHVTPRWETARGGAGQIRVDRFVSLRDPDRRLGFAIVNGSTRERLLTGADLDVESIVRAKDGSFWIGEEFGPFLVHVDRTGKVLEREVPLPGVRSPQNPYLAAGEVPTVRASKGFEAMAGSDDGRYLYPVLEGALVADDDQRRRVIHQYDTRTHRYTDRTWAYQTDTDANLVADAFMTGRSTMLVLERDSLDGAAAVTKRVYEIDLARTDVPGSPRTGRGGYVDKTLVLDALRIANPDGLGAGAGDGTGDPYAFAYNSFETVVRLHDGRLLLANDNNYPGDDARVPGTPDDTEMAIVDLRTVRAPKDDGVTVVGHRGASGYRPEHTLASYETAILQCADYIEPDLVPTKDGVLVARHENEIGGTTDVAAHPEFAARRTTKVVDGVRLTGWFTEDFTLAELRTLRAKERIPGTRPDNVRFDGLYPVPTFDEVLDLARHSRTCDGGPVGVYPETKHPTYFDQVGLSLEEPLVAQLAANGMNRASSPVIVQSFETANLRELNRATPVAIAQLVSCSGAPYDLVAAGDPRTYADLVTRDGLREIARYADGIGACKDVMIPRTPAGTLGTPTTVIRDAHRAGLDVHGWTFRRENTFLPVEFRQGTDPNAVGDLAGEIRVFLDAGMDGFFTDDPDLGVAAVR